MALQERLVRISTEEREEEKRSDGFVPKRGEIFVQLAFSEGGNK